MYSSLLTAWSTTPVEGVDFRGVDMRYTMVKSAEACQTACNEEAKCQFYTYVQENFPNRAVRYSVFRAAPLLKQNKKIFLKLEFCAVGAAAT